MTWSPRAPRWQRRCASYAPRVGSWWVRPPSPRRSAEGRGGTLEADRPVPPGGSKGYGRDQESGVVADGRWAIGIEGLPGPRRTIPNNEENDVDNDVDIVVTGRHTQITDRFRQHLEEKLSKVPQLLPRVSRIDVVVTHEKAVRDCDAVEITCHAKGPVIRAEACTDDPYAALDIALDKLFERLRRATDRRRVSRTGRRVPESVAQATGRLAEEASEGEVLEADPGATSATPASNGAFGAVGDSPIEVREKVHAS